MPDVDRRDRVYIGLSSAPAVTSRLQCQPLALGRSPGSERRDSGCLEACLDVLLCERDRHSELHDEGQPLVAQWLSLSSGPLEALDHLESAPRCLSVLAQAT